jgi:hypothetical protein
VGGVIVAGLVQSLTNDYSTWHLESWTRVEGVTTPVSYRTFTCQVTVCRKAGW